MGCGQSSEGDNVSTAGSSGSAKKTKVAPFENGKPSVEYDEKYGCFREEEPDSDTDEDDEKKKSKKKKDNKKQLPGKLYRLVNNSNHKWYFYNDTKNYNMVVTGYFGPMNELTAKGKTRMWREMPSGLIIAELVIEPLETEPYVEGIVSDGFDLRFKALPKAEKKKRNDDDSE